MPTVTGTIEARDYPHEASIKGHVPVFGHIYVTDVHEASVKGSVGLYEFVSGNVFAIDVHQASVVAGLASSGNIQAVDYPHQFFITGSDLRTGTITAVDSTHYSNTFSSIVIGDTTQIQGDSTFLQGSLIDSFTGLILTLFDSTYVDGSWSGDGTHIDSTYWEPRLFNPLWIDYSIWYTPDSTTEIIQGTKKRVPLNPKVGYFYANMYAPNKPGLYDIRWRYQQDSHLLAKEIREPFSVTPFGTKSDSTTGFYI